MTVRHSPLELGPYRFEGAPREKGRKGGDNVKEDELRRETMECDRRVERYDIYLCSIKYLFEEDCSSTSPTALAHAIRHMQITAILILSCIKLDMLHLKTIEERKRQTNILNIHLMSNIALSKCLTLPLSHLSCPSL